MRRSPGIGPFSQEQSPLWPARAMGYLFACGGLLVLASCLFPGRESVGWTAACAGIAFVTAALLIARRTPLPLTFLSTLLGLGSALVVGVIAFSGRGGSLDAILFVWVAAYAGYFLTRTWLAIHLVLVALLYAGVLLGFGDEPARIQHWMLVTGGVAAAGVFVALLRTQADHLVERRLEDARIDALTGLANRAQLADRAAAALARHRRGGDGVGLLLIDLDDFKLVNDALGHAAGDQLLREAAARLCEVVRATDLVVRLGGDEFGILLEPVDLPAGAADAAQRALDVLGQSFALQGEAVELPASVGIAIASDEHTTLADLMREADLAMYAAKGAGGGFAFFAPEMQAEALRRRELTRDLQRAVGGDELVLHFQPIVDLRDDRTVAVEALVRWDHPERGIVGPDAFIPRAEQSGLIIDIGRWVLDAACAEAARWRAAHGDAAPALSVNLSPRQLHDPALVEDVAAVLRRHAIPASALMLEITETAVMADHEAAVRRLEALRALGVRIAIDDFGTGHSSLAYLRRLPAQDLKLARLFVSDLERTPESLALARGIVGLAQALGMRVIAEGVEEPGERDRLRGMGCDLAQGFLFARPLVPQALRDRLAAEEPAAAPAPAPAAPADAMLEPVLVSALSDLRERHRALLSVCPGAVIMVFDAELRWRVIEGQLVEQLGWQPDEMLGRRPSEVLPAARAEALEQHLRAALGGSREQLEWVSVRGARPFLVDVMPVRAGGVISGALLVGRDEHHAGAQARVAATPTTPAPPSGSSAPNPTWERSWSSSS